jgi:hypothetical protein
MLGLRRVFASLFVLPVVATLSAAQTKTIQHNIPPVSEEQLSVYRGFLEKLGGVLHSKSLSKITLPFNFDGFPEGRPCLTGIELENPSEALKAVHTFGPEITEGRGLTLVDPFERTKLLDERSGSSNQPKRAVQSGNDLDFLILSEIAFDTKHQFAVLKYLLVCGTHCDSGATLVMEKIDGHWTTSSRRPCAMFLN